MAKVFNTTHHDEVMIFISSTPVHSKKQTFEEHVFLLKCDLFRVDSHVENGFRQSQRSVTHSCSCHVMWLSLVCGQENKGVHIDSGRKNKPNTQRQMVDLTFHLRLSHAVRHLCSVSNRENRHTHTHTCWKEEQGPTVTSAHLLHTCSPLEPCSNLRSQPWDWALPLPRASSWHTWQAKGHG